MFSRILPSILLFLAQISATTLNSTKDFALMQNDTTKNDFVRANCRNIYQPNIRVYNPFEYCTGPLSSIRHGDNDERLVWTEAQTTFRSNESECVIQWSRTLAAEDPFTTRFWLAYAATALEEQCFVTWDAQFPTQQGIIDVRSVNGESSLKYTLRRDFTAEGGLSGDIQTVESKA